MHTHTHTSTHANTRPDGLFRLLNKRARFIFDEGHVAHAHTLINTHTKNVPAKNSRGCRGAEQTSADRRIVKRCERVSLCMCVCVCMRVTHPLAHTYHAQCYCVIWFSLQAGRAVITLCCRKKGSTASFAFEAEGRHGTLSRDGANINQPLCICWLQPNG